MTVHEHKTTIRCFETMGVPNTVAECSCGDKKSYYPSQAEREGYDNDLAAAQDWAYKHRAGLLKHDWVRRTYAEQLKILTREPKCVIVADLGMGSRVLAAHALARRSPSLRNLVPVIVDSKVLQRDNEEVMREAGYKADFDYITPQKLVRMGPWPKDFPAANQDIMFQMDHFRNPKTYGHKAMLNIVTGAQQGIMVIHAADHRSGPLAAMAARFAPNRAWVGLDRREIKL